jgi:flavin reductase (DIM6/NTAB) family NADH-FMN oxidoreductase RutF
MLVSCGGRNRTNSKGIGRDEQGKRKIPRLAEASLSYAEGWEYVAEGGANVIFRHEDSSESVLRVPKSNPFEIDELFDFIKDSILPMMNNKDPYSDDGDNYFCDRIKDYYCIRSCTEEELDEKYRFYGELVKPNGPLFLIHLNEKLASSNRPEHRRGSRLVTNEFPVYVPEPIWLMLLPNVVDVGEICIELKPKSSLGPHNTTYPKRYDGMAMKQRTCRYCMHQEWKVHNGKIPNRRPIDKSYCPMDLFSNNKRRMKRAILALMDDPQNNFKVFAPDGRDITPEAVAATKPPSKTTAFQDLTGMEQDELMEVIVEGLCESRVLDDLHRAHEFDELDIEGIWQLHQLIESSKHLNGLTRMNDRPSPPSPPQQQQGKQQQQFKLDPKTCRSLSAIGCTENDYLSDVRKRYQFTLEKFLLATTMKDCSILLSIRRERSLQEGTKRNDEIWNELEYRIEWKGRVYKVLISIIDLDMKSERNLPKYHNLDQDIVHHYSETHGLHEIFCFGPCLSEEENSRSLRHEDDDSVVQIKGNMMCRLLYPNPVCLLTVYDPTRHTANAMTVTWLTAIDNHGTFVCSISKRRHTSELLRVSSVFVLNVPTRDLEDTILAIGSSSGRETDKFRELGLRTCCPGWFPENSNNKASNNNDHHATKHAIALRDCIAHTVCLVQEKQDMGQHWLMVCKQQLAWSKKAYFADGKRFIRCSESLSPYLTFLGTQTFGSVV